MSEGYSTLGEVESENLSRVNHVSLRINRFLISYLISKQARLDAAFNSVLVLYNTEESLGLNVLSLYVGFPGLLGKCTSLKYF